MYHNYTTRNLVLFVASIVRVKAQLEEAPVKINVSKCGVRSVDLIGGLKCCWGLSMGLLLRAYHDYIT